MTDDYNPLINADRYKSRIDMSVIGPMKKFDPLPIPFQSVPIKSVPIETESEKIGTRLIGIGIGVTRYLDAFYRKTCDSTSQICILDNEKQQFCTLCACILRISTFCRRSRSFYVSATSRFAHGQFANVR